MLIPSLRRPCFPRSPRPSPRAPFGARIRARLTGSARSPSRVFSTRLGIACRRARPRFLEDLLRDVGFLRGRRRKEVVLRLAAKPDTSNYSRLSVMAQYHFQVTPLFIVPPESFEPVPKVDSAIVRLVPHESKPVQVKDDKAFAKLVSQAFSQRRKTLRNVLKDICTMEQLESVGIDPTKRAQTLTLQQFADLFNHIY